MSDAMPFAIDKAAQGADLSAPPTLPDEDLCLDSLFRLKLAKLGACPGCASTTTRFYKLRTRKAYICQRCGHKIQPCANTFLHKSSTSLQKWLLAMHLLAQSEGAISARELGSRLQVTHKCARRMRDRLKAAMRGKFTAAATDPMGDGGGVDHAGLLNAFVFAALPGAGQSGTVGGE